MRPESPPPAPSRRLVSLDVLRGLAIAAVLMLHCLQYVIDENVLENNLQFSLPLYYLGGMSGLFFCVSSLGSTIAISRRMIQHDSQQPVPLDSKKKRRAQRQACGRGLVLMFIGYATQIFVFRIWEDNFLMHYNRGGLKTTMSTPEQVAWVFTDRFTRNFIIESIGFCGIFTSLVTIEVAERRTRGQCPQKTVTNLMSFLVIAILILNPLLRVGLDSATCCVPESCSWYPSSSGDETFSNPPEILYPPNGTCVINFNPCQFDDSAETYNNASSASISQHASVRTKVNTSTWQQRNDACLNVYNTYGNRDSSVALHGLGLGKVGRQWCTSEVASGTPNNTLAVQICKLKPAWGRGTDFGRKELNAVGAAGAVGVSLLQLFFGRFGFFAYGAPATIGCAIGLFMERPERTASQKIVARINPVLPWSCVRASLMWCFGSFLLGLLLFLWLVVEGADDAALQAGTHIRLFVGAGEISLVLISLSLIDFNNKSSCFYFVRDKCRCVRRCGSLTLTLWTLQWLNLILVIVLDEIGGKNGIWKSRANGERTYTWNVLFILLFAAPLWYALTSGCEKIQFVGSMEWLLGKMTGSSKSGSKSGQRMIQVLDACEPFYSESDFFLGRPRNIIKDEVTSTTCCELCFCCCCLWTDQVVESSISEDGTMNMELMPVEVTESR